VSITTAMELSIGAFESLLTSAAGAPQGKRRGRPRV
jgi:hypothetical protein